MATIEVKVPDIGEFRDVEVIEVLVKPGDRIAPEQSLITVESDKASMEIPAPLGGVVVAMKVALGDKVSRGSLLMDLEVSEAGEAAPPPAGGAAVAGGSAPADAVAAGAPAGARVAFDAAPAADVGEAPAVPAADAVGRSVAAPLPAGAADAASDAVVQPHASPSVRRFARELGVDLSRVRGSGPKQRILHDDVRAWVKALAARADDPGSTGGAPGVLAGLPPWPQVDFAKFGPVEARPLSRIRKLSAANLHRNWVAIPHVSQHEDADVTDLESLRTQLNRENEGEGAKLTMLAFLVKACVSALKKFPEFNASLDGDTLVLKRYYHVGFAADTPNGLVVPVIRDADRKGVLEIARESAELAAKARAGKLMPSDMQGGTFSISSLGGIGGTYFTPIINAPEVAILGVCRAARRPVWDGSSFQPRLVLPMSLSYDHRVIDGAAAARFNAWLAQLLADFRRAML